MHRDKKQLTKTSHVLLYLLAAGDLLYRSKMRGRLSLALYPEYRNYLANRRLETIFYKFRKRGWIKEEYKESKRIVKLTKEGELEALFQKARLDEEHTAWDGKWRMVVFDIPEDARAIRDRLRTSLKQFGFYGLQASVYVYPFSLNIAAMEYLNKSKLNRYIRFARIDALDNDTDLLHHFRNIIPKTNGRDKRE